MCNDWQLRARTSERYSRAHCSKGTASSGARWGLISVKLSPRQLQQQQQQQQHARADWETEVAGSGPHIITIVGVFFILWSRLGNMKLEVARNMAHQQTTAVCSSSGRATRQLSRHPRAGLPMETNTITSSPETSLQVDIEKLSKGLGSVDLRQKEAPVTPAWPTPTTQADSVAAVKYTTQEKAVADKKSTKVQQPRQEPPIVRRSRRGERAMSLHPQIGRYRVEITSSERLWCGKFALGISTEQQLGIRLTVEDFDEIFAGEESRTFNEKHGWVGVEDTARNFYDEQLDFVLRAWGRKHGLRLQLGVVRDFEGVFVNGALGDERRDQPKEEGEEPSKTVWIHNDNAMLLGRPYNHYSGISVLEKAC